MAKMTEEEAKAAIKKMTPKEVYELVSSASNADERLTAAQNRERTKTQLMMSMGAELGGSLAGGAAVGVFRAYQHEELLIPVSAGLTLVGAYMRTKKPRDPMGEIAFSAGHGMGAALVAVEVEAKINASRQQQKAA